MHDFKPLQSREIQAIRQRHEQATAGPWEVCERKIDTFLTDRCVVTTWTDPRSKWQVPIVSASQSRSGTGVWIDERDARFIAAARTDVPRLLATLDTFGHRVIYIALKYYYEHGSYGQEEGAILEEAMDTCWQLLRARDDF